MSGCVTIITSISELELSVILVGVVITCFKFASDIKLANALFSGLSVKTLQLRSPMVTIGLLRVSEWIKLGLRRSSKQDNGQSGGRHDTQITTDLSFLLCNFSQSCWKWHKDTWEISFRMVTLISSRMKAQTPPPRLRERSCLNNL